MISIHALARSSRSAFSLLELLCSVAIMSATMGVLAPAVTGLVGSGSIDTGTRTVVDLLQYARSTAISKHTLVRVLIARDWSGDAGSDLRKLSVWSYDDQSEQFFPETKWHELPAGVVLDPNVPSFVHPPAYVTNDPTSVRGDYPLSSDGSETDFTLQDPTGAMVAARYLEFLPTGSVRVGEGIKRNVILRVTRGVAQRGQVTYTERPGGQVANWAQVNTDTLTGRVRVYRP